MSAVDDETSLMVNIEVQIIQNMGISRYFAAAGLVFLMYDTVLTIGEEIRLVWPGPLKFPKFLYYINRYWTIASLIVANYMVAGFRPPLSITVVVSPLYQHLVALTKQSISCQIWLFVGAIAEMIAEVASSAILVLRVAALFERDKWVVRGLWIISGLLYTVTIILAVFTINQFYKNLVYDPLAAVCLPVDMSNKSYAMFAIPLALDVIIVVLTTFKTYRLAVAVQREHGAVILYTMLWDGILYFMTIVALRVFNTVVWAAFPNSLMYLGVYTYWALISTLTSRLFLNLRSAAFGGPRYVQSQSRTTFPSGDKQGKRRASVLTLGRRKQQAMNPDATLSSTTPSASFERSTYTEVEQMPRRGAPEIEYIENLAGGDLELQPRETQRLDVEPARVAIL